MTFLLIPQVLCAVVLLVSGVAKLRDPQATSDAVVALRVPGRLVGVSVSRALPWVEIALGLAIGLTAGWFQTLAAIGALALFVCYTVVVGRALGFAEPVTCACFGALGEQGVSERTMVRNVLLVVTAVLALAGSIAGVALIWLWGRPETWGWLLVSALTGAVALLVLGRGRAAASAMGAGAGLDAEDDGEYLRVPVPEVIVVARGGEPRALRELAVAKARLLVTINCLCSGSMEVLTALPEWARRLEMLEVSLLSSVALESLPGVDELSDRLWYDHLGLAQLALGVSKSPSAVLLGTDGLLAGGPVVGLTDIEQFVADIEERLSGPVV